MGEEKDNGGIIYIMYTLHLSQYAGRSPEDPAVGWVRLDQILNVRDAPSGTGVYIHTGYGEVIHAEETAEQLMGRMGATVFTLDL